MAAAAPGISCCCAGSATSNAARVIDHRGQPRRRYPQQRGADRARDSRITLEREATVISYGEAADGIVTTARRSATPRARTRCLVVFLKQDYTLERLVGWDALGMRGTCSAGFQARRLGCERADSCR
jgi:acyl-CoA dehydrogenase